nr:MAG TPA: hypothetical protein [Caudoviricetes sp.]
MPGLINLKLTPPSFLISLTKYFSTSFSNINILSSRV